MIHSINPYYQKKKKKEARPSPKQIKKHQNALKLTSGILKKNNQEEGRQ